ncbi:hypothetical protein G9A89_012887 [Geosiphon pyriformis]|nr:hypothetical protein G9A89_012887 [Geosiphon pyriformis]
MLEIPVSTMVQVASRLSLNNSDKLYKIKSHKKIAQAIFLPLIKIPQLVPVTTQEELGLTAQKIKGFGSSRRDNIMVNFMVEDSDQVELIYTNTIISIPSYWQYILKVNQKIQNQALVFEANLKICLLADVVNLYLPAKAHKHFKIPIHNLTKNIIEIPERILIGSIFSNIQNPKKLQLISDFIQLFLFCDITSQVWNLPKESYLFMSKKINKLNLENLSTL